MKKVVYLFIFFNSIKMIGVMENLLNPPHTPMYETDQKQMIENFGNCYNSHNPQEETTCLSRVGQHIRKFIDQNKAYNDYINKLAALNQQEENLTSLRNTTCGKYQGYDVNTDQIQGCSLQDIYNSFNGAWSGLSCVNSNGIQCTSDADFTTNMCTSIAAANAAEFAVYKSACQADPINCLLPLIQAMYPIDSISNKIQASYLGMQIPCMLEGKLLLGTGTNQIAYDTAENISLKTLKQGMCGYIPSVTGNYCPFDSLKLNCYNNDPAAQGTMLLGQITSKLNLNAFGWCNNMGGMVLATNDQKCVVYMPDRGVTQGP